MGNPFVHVELATTDLAKAKSFYQSVFDWTLKEMPMANGKTYTMVHVGEGTGGGMMDHPRPGAPSTWLPYVAVEDIGKTIEKARTLGAVVRVEPTEVKDCGWYAVITDPTGAALGLWMMTNKGC